MLRKRTFSDLYSLKCTSFKNKIKETKKRILGKNAICQEGSKDRSQNEGKNESGIKLKAFQQFQAAYGYYWNFLSLWYVFKGKKNMILRGE